MTHHTVSLPPAGVWSHLSPQNRRRLLALLSRWVLRRWASQHLSPGGNHEPAQPQTPA